MTEMACHYPGDRDEAMIAYLYDDGDPAARAGFEAHLAACARCRTEVDALRGVRRQLARWAPPEVNFTVESLTSGVGSDEAATSHQSPATGHRAWWHEIPAWAQVAAALLVLGVSAGVANLDVRYDGNGLSVRTGWATPAPVAASAPAPVDVSVPARAAQSSDADLLRRVRALLDESEKRQQRELALRVGEVLRDVNAARQADLRTIDRNVNDMQNRLGVEVLKQRENLNMLMRVSQRQ